VWEERFEGLPTTEILGRELPVATTQLTRLLGLALLDPIAAGQGLVIPCCRAVHSFGMRFALDLVFLDSSGRVLELRRRVRPGRFARSAAADSVVELPTR